MSLADRSDTTSRLAAGAAGGIAAYVLGYLLVYVTQRGGIEEQLEAFNFIADLFGSDPIPSWQAVGWVFYNAHFVVTEVPVPFGGVRSENFIAGSDEGTLTALYVVPPLLLLLAGLAAGRIANADDPAVGAQAGALLVIGYLPLAVIGALLFGYSIGDGTIAPDLITAVLLAGVVYPVAFGAIGGAASTLLGGE
ncbi:transporter [Halorubrum tibetense]|uniref:Transporter n=1 Tax=Halorubrum tibetense TaxID=175631 RepID=A0ABD5SCA4_9EURY